MPLQEIAGQRIQNFRWEADLKQVLEYYDGSRLVVRKDTSGTLYLDIWNDSQDGQERWLALEISRSRLRYVLSGEIGLREALQNPQNGQLMVIDEDQEGNLTATITTLAAVPENSWPAPEAKLNIPIPEALNTP